MFNNRKPFYLFWHVRCMICGEEGLWATEEKQRRNQSYLHTICSIDFYCTQLIGSTARNTWVLDDKQAIDTIKELPYPSLDRHRDTLENVRNKRVNAPELDFPLYHWCVSGTRASFCCKTVENLQLKQGLLTARLASVASSPHRLIASSPEPAEIVRMICLWDLNITLV